MTGSGYQRPNCLRQSNDRFAIPRRTFATATLNGRFGLPVQPVHGESYSRGQRKLVQTAAMLFPSEFAQHGRLLDDIATLSGRRVAV
jgi:hypothetical protein